MPAVSEKQRRFIYARKGKAFARRHHFDNKGKLPERAPKRDDRAALLEAFKRRGKKRRKRGQEARS